MNRNEYKGLKGAAISMLWIIEKTNEPFRKSDFFRLFSDKTVASAIDDLLESELIIEQENNSFIINPEYLEQVGVFPTPTTSIYINNIVKFKDIKNSNRSEKFRQDVYDLLKGVGVGEPVLSRYAAKKHITPEFVQWRIDQWRDQCEKGKKYTVGWLITSLDRVEDPPKPKILCPLHGKWTTYDGKCIHTGCNWTSADLNQERN